MNPPKCPNCGEPLNKVQENANIEYKWLSKKGFYTGDINSIDINNQCPHCESDLSKIFPKRVDNYFKRKENEQDYS